MIECISLVFLSISPFRIFGKRDISAEKSTEAAAERIKISTISIHTYSRESMKTKESVINISIRSSDIIKGLKEIRSMRIPISGARITAGNIDIAAVKAMVTASALKATSMEKIATWENQFPK